MVVTTEMQLTNIILSPTIPVPNNLELNTGTANECKSLNSDLHKDLKSSGIKSVPMITSLPERNELIISNDSVTTNENEDCVCDYGDIYEQNDDDEVGKENKILSSDDLYKNRSYRNRENQHSSNSNDNIQIPSISRSNSRSRSKSRSISKSRSNSRSRSISRSRSHSYSNRKDEKDEISDSKSFNLVRNPSFNRSENAKVYSSASSFSSTESFSSADENAGSQTNKKELMQKIAIPAPRAKSPSRVVLNNDSEAFKTNDESQRFRKVSSFPTRMPILGNGPNPMSIKRKSFSVRNENESNKIVDLRRSSFAGTDNDSISKGSISSLSRSSIGSNGFINNNNSRAKSPSKFSSFMMLSASSSPKDLCNRLGISSSSMFDGGKKKI
jgi:hypothetical protein